MGDNNIYNKNIYLKLKDINKQIKILEKNKVDLIADLTNYISDENYYIRKNTNKKIFKNLLTPVVIVSSLLSFLSLVVTSKILLIIILGNLITSSIIVSMAINYISELAKKEVRRKRNDYYLELYSIEQKLNLFVEKRWQLLNMCLKTEEIKVQNEELSLDSINKKNTTSCVRVRKR